MNKKGFTLIELLAVIIILSLLATLASTSVTKVVKDSKSDLYNAQLESIKSAAQSWGADNLNRLPSNGECQYLTLKDLKEYGLLDSNVKDPRNNKEFSDDMKIKITSKITQYGTTNVSYEVDAKNIDSCKYVYQVCTLADDSEKTGIEIGAKYNCKVDLNKEAYTFYVLSTNLDETTNLIMDRNICIDGTPTDVNKEDKCLVAYNDLNVVAGPITAITYLNTATSTWENVKNLDLTYDDEGGNFTGFEINGKARLPYYNELSVYNRNDMYDYLSDGGRQTNIIDGIYGYWTLSSVLGNSSLAYYINYIEGLYDDASIYDKELLGVRPVITINNSQIGQ